MQRFENLIVGNKDLKHYFCKFCWGDSGSAEEIQFETITILIYDLWSIDLYAAALEIVLSSGG